MRLAVVVRTLLVVSIAAGWLGCGGGGGTVDVTPPPPPTLTSISISPSGAAVAVNGTLQFTLTGSYSDGSSRNLTSNVTWTSSSTGAATITSTGLASGAAAGVTVITATSGTLTDQTALNVTTMALDNSILQGNYVFSYTGHQFVLGVFTADGQGHITGGQVDSNTAYAAVSSAVIGGGYEVYPDGRGTLTLQAASPLGLNTFRFVLSQDGSRGYLHLFDATGLAIGTLERQASPPPNLNSAFVGNYAFRMGGFNTVGAPALDFMAVVGILNADGMGHFTTGQAHINDGGSLDQGTIPPTPITFTGTYEVPNVGVRGNATIDNGQGDVFSFAFYFVSADKAYLIETDTAASRQVLFGPIEKQTGVPFSVASAAGGYVFLAENGGMSGSFAVGGQFVLNGASGVLNGVQVETTGSGPRAEAPLLPGNYTIAPDGSLSLTWTLDPGGPRSFLGYMVSPTKMFLLESSPADWVSCGTAERQMTGPFNLTSVQGVYAIHMSQIMTGGLEETVVGQLIGDGAGNLHGIGDLSEGPSGRGYAEMAATYQFPADHSSFGQGMTLVEGEEYYFYVISGSKLVIFSESNPGAVGFAELQ